MKKTILCAALLTNLLSPAIPHRTLYASERPAKEQFAQEGEARRLATELLEGRMVRVRVYPAWRDNPRYYYMVSVPMKTLTLNTEPVHNKIEPDPRPAVLPLTAEDRPWMEKLQPARRDPPLNRWTLECPLLVFLGSEQEDKIVAELFKDWVYVQTYAPGNMSPIWYEYRNDPGRQIWTFVDALGDPIPNAVVDVFICDDRGPAAHLTQIALDENGRARGLKRLYGLSRFMFLVSHPEYGTASVRRRGGASIEHPSDPLVLPLVHVDSEARSCGFQGVVLDTAGRPVPGAAVRCYSVDKLRHRKMQHYPQLCYTDADGRFAFYVPVYREDRLISEPVESQGECRIIVEPPDGTDLRSLPASITAGLSTTVTCEALSPETYFRTLAFEDYDGTITDPAELERIIVRVVRRGAPLLEYTYDQWKDGTHFPAGEFSAEIFHNNERIRFESVRVTPDSPKEIVLVTGRTTLYQGRVINGSTGRPMSGAIVAVSPHLAGEHMIGKKQLESLLENTLTFESEDLNAERLHSRRGRAARTDEEGFYEFTFLSGGDLTRLNYFRAMHPDHLSSFARLYTNRAAVNGVIDVPPIYVYPVATVIIEPSSTVDTWNGTAKVSWDIIPNGQTEHIEHPVILQTGRKGIDAKTSRMLLRFSVPADVTCDLTFAAVCRDGELAPVTLKGIRLSAGQTVRLGKVVFEPPSEVTLTVKVVRDDGRPVPGVGLTCEIDGRDSRRTSSTDSNGLVSIGVPTHSQGRFVYRVSDFPLIERNWSVPWQVGGAEDQREQLTLQLSGEFVFSGQVLNGITGAPEPGAFVMILSAACSIDASHLTPEHWDAAEAIGRDWNENDPALVPLRRAFDFVKIARTDTQGRYRIAIEPFDSITGMGVGTIRRNMIGHRWNVSFPALPPGRLQLRHHEHIEVPPLRIYPAGRIAIQANLIEQGIKTKPEIRSRFDVVPGQIVPWADHLTKATLLRDYTLRANTPQIILLPAGITLDLKLSEVRTCEFAPIAIGHVRVTADQTLHLGQVSLEPAMPVVVQVTDTRGNPLSGVKIRVKRILEQQLQIPARVPAVTNADGKASTTVFPNAVVQFSVLDPAGITYGGRTDAYTESVEYQIGGREDKNKEFTFQLSDKMLQLLFQ